MTAHIESDGVLWSPPNVCCIRFYMDWRSSICFNWM